MLTKYCPKRIHFSMEGMITRTQLAVLDFNSGTNCEQAVTKKGALCYKQFFSRVTQSWVVKKISKKKEKVHLEELMTAMLLKQSEQDFSNKHIFHLLLDIFFE